MTTTTTITCIFCGNDLDEDQYCATCDTERNAALFNLSVGEFTTGQEVRDGRIVRHLRTECEECGHPLKDGDETHYPDCSQIFVGM